MLKDNTKTEEQHKVQEEKNRTREEEDGKDAGEDDHGAWE